MAVGQYGGNLDKVVNGHGFGQMDGAKSSGKAKKGVRGDGRWEMGNGKWEEDELLIRRGQRLRKDVGSEH